MGPGSPGMRDATEARLIDRCRAGEAEAWDELFNRHCAPAYRFVFQLGFSLSHEDAEEICQEAFLKEEEQKALVLDTIDSVQKQHHGRLVIWTETPGHVRLHHATICNKAIKISFYEDFV